MLGWLRIVASRVWGSLWRRAADQDFARELESHLEMLAQENVRRGMAPEEARRAARVRLGGMTQISEKHREMHTLPLLETLVQDIRYGLRTLRKSPGFTSVAVLTLALGIGANTAIFQLVDALRMRTIPVKEPQQLVTVQLADPTGMRGSQASAYPVLTNAIWEKLRDNQDVFSGVLAWGSNNFGITPGGEVRLAQGLFVSGDFFHVLGVRPLMGRVFTASEDRRGCGLPGAVVSYAFWQRELGGDPSPIGRKLTLNYHPVEIIGVTPPGFFGLEVGRSYDVAVPICSQAFLWSEGTWLDEGTVWWLNVIGRLRPSSTREKANAQLAASSPGIFQATLPSNYPSENVKDYLKFKLTAVPAGSGVSWLRMEYSDSLSLLLGTAGLVLLIACANLANLMLARATTREREFTVRFAIGASRSQLIRHSMGESLLLAPLGGALGLFLAGALSKFLVASLGTEGDPLFLDLKLDWRLLTFTFGLASLTCILFGLVPALRASRISPAEAFKTASRTATASRKRFGFRQGLVVSQVALSLVLVVGALLFSGSLRNLLAVDTGFSQKGVVITELDLFRRLNVPYAGRVAFKQDLLQKVRGLPGVLSAAEVEILPLSGSSTDNEVWIEGGNPASRVDSRFNRTSDGYFKAMGIALLVGRDFTPQDTVTSPKVAIVNQTFARKLGLGANPIGKTFRRQATPSEPEQSFEIVGLVADTKYSSLREEFAPIVFLSTSQDPQPGPFAQVVIRSATPIALTVSNVRSLVAQASPLITLGFQAFETAILEGLTRERLMATVSGFFGLLAALIAAVGLYGVMSYLVAQRTNEIGIRVALGAQRVDVLSLVLRNAALLLAPGLVLGAFLSLAAAQAARAMLFGLKPSDPGVLVAAIAGLGLVVLVASFPPARRAMSVDPMVALRYE
ncbi:MAG TPA: ABC transporter permease [Candidatus Acidoferrum sp.]|nr:ABC transporter permease [Candidatus Acidoferrum sp.]